MCRLFFCLETEPVMKTNDLMWAAFASGLGVIAALIAVKFLGVDPRSSGLQPRCRRTRPVREIIHADH